MCGPPAALARPQQEPEVIQRGRPGHWNPDPLDLQADITAQQHQKERGRERRTGSAKWRSGSRPWDGVKRRWQMPSSDDSEPAIDWNQNKIGPATWESAGPQAPKSPARASRTPSSTRGSNQPAARYSQSRPTMQKEKEDEATRKAKAQEAQKKLEEEIILKYPGTYISTRIGKMLTERFMSEARSLRFYEAGAMTHTKELVALADWGYQYCLISHSPLPDIRLEECGTQCPGCTPPDTAGNSGYPQKEMDALGSSVLPSTVLDRRSRIPGGKRFLWRYE